MLCDDCKKRPAAVHITKIVNNQKTEKHLCEQCAKASGEMDFSWGTQFSVNDLLKGFFAHNPGLSVQPAVVCPHCGMSYEEFSRTSKLGCGACYTAFGRRLEPLLRQIHGANAHTGKAPRRTGGTFGMQQRLKVLRQDLERHIQHEEYEQAAKVRDEIRALEKDMDTRAQ